MSGDNYYLFRSIIVGAQGTGKTTFFNQTIHGKENIGDLNRVGTKDFVNIGGKSKVKLEMEDMPQSFATIT